MNPPNDRSRKSKSGNRGKQKYELRAPWEKLNTVGAWEDGNLEKGKNDNVIIRLQEEF